MDAAKPNLPGDLTSDADVAVELVTLTEAARLEIERFRRAHETKVLTIFFSDLVGSTELQVEQGNERAARLVQEHYAIMRRVLAGYDGQEISTAGDSMLMVFAAPAEAVKFALYAQRAMADEHQRQPLLPPMRCGIHQGQVVLQKEQGKPDITDIYGMQVSMAARIMSLGQSGQILLSRAVFDDARTILAHDDFPGMGEIGWANHGGYRFKGIREEFDVCEVGEKGISPLTSPQEIAKAWPVRLAVAGQPADVKADSTARHRPWIAVAMLLMFAIAIGVFVTWGSSTAKVPSTTTVDPRADLKRQLAQVESTLANLSGLDEELLAMEGLDKRYREATNVIFGGQPSQVRTEAMQFLSRLRTYELTPQEQALVAKADAKAAGKFEFYPEEVYNPVRQLAELLAARKTLLKEQERLRAELVR